MKKYFLTCLIFLLILPNISRSETALAGRILLQVEDKGQAWYVSPTDEKRYSLGRPDEAFDLMRKLGVGITDKDLTKMPVGIAENNYPDSDADGIYDYLEDTLGTDKNNKDTDADGYDDKTELTGGYDPLGPGKLPIDLEFAKKHSGKIFLQVEKNGQAWYLEPVTKKRYFLGRPNDAFEIMRTFGLGITNADLDKIPTDQLPAAVVTLPPSLPQNESPVIPAPTPAATENVLSSAASAIRTANASSAKSYFTANMNKSIEYSMQHMAKENLLLLANILSGSTLKSSTASKKTYANEVYFQGEKHPVYFYVEKQSDGKWLMTNL